MTRDSHFTNWPQAERAMAHTHKVENQPPPLVDYNLYTTDQALQEWAVHYGVSPDDVELVEHGAWAGSAEAIELGFQANAQKPELFTHDRFGQRIDAVRFHQAYHALIQRALETGLHCSPWLQPGPTVQVHRALRYYLHVQVEAAHGCPVTMTYAAFPAIARQPELAEQWLPKLLRREYDGRNVPYFEKSALTLGMAMTEKQGGSDVRRNSTRAYPVAAEGSGQVYELVGHKYFVSAPMSDAFLVLAQAPGGLSCFLLPRWRPDGSKNPLQIQRLKNKMGNVANASSETELRGAMAWMLGKEGKGINTIIEMVALTRFDCMIGSSGGMRQAVAQAVHHASHREAFGAPLSKQPLMQNVLADLALENEAALAMTLRMAHALDKSDDAHEQALLRIGTAIGKYWICKRTPQHAYEAMECIGGSGLMEDCIMPRLLRESPVNAIWEGSGNVQCLDILRAAERNPESLQALLAEIDTAVALDRRMASFVERLKQDLANSDELAYRARDIADRMALALQASLLLRGPAPWVGEIFCRARLSGRDGLNYGTLPAGVDCAALIKRCFI